MEQKKGTVKTRQQKLWERIRELQGRLIVLPRDGWEYELSHWEVNRLYGIWKRWWPQRHIWE
jgi:hypothetical protein